MILELIFTLYFGACCGSFLCATAERQTHEISLLTPRSFCISCGKILAWYDLLPIFSFLILRGRCRHCNQPIPNILFISELAGSILSFLAYQHPTHSYISAWILFNLLYFSLFDYFDHHIPLLPFYLNSTILTIVMIQYGYPLHFYAACGLFLVLSLFVYFSPEQMGFGDVQFLTIVCLFIGISKVQYILMSACILAIIFHLDSFKNSTFHSNNKLEIPLIPYLSFGIFCLYLFHL